MKTVISSVPVLACIAAVLVAGCVPSPENYETTPVQVQTDKGIVTCQLYSKDLVVWDRAIDRPNSMGVQEADAICKEEGKREKRR
ncbi:hypothetical protein M3P21_01210 [Ruegeria sp. 2012CJ41-6]|uniref:Uncharacterized protein n=1 Tax=Ruegeria spongiae TaxID=2942209 RepID=A0ABT0PX28_9RHOB|nr:hypothetical protein [Ruegeria spongiae]MCL6282135.1 hypothetical protein [Ruegeria spongiae]